MRPYVGTYVAVFLRFRPSRIGKSTHSPTFCKIILATSRSSTEGRSRRWSSPSPSEFESRHRTILRRHQQILEGHSSWWLSPSELASATMELGGAMSAPDLKLVRVVPMEKGDSRQQGRGGELEILVSSPSPKQAPGLAGREDPPRPSPCVARSGLTYTLPCPSPPRASLRRPRRVLASPAATSSNQANYQGGAVATEAAARVRRRRPRLVPLGVRPSH
jgi:hypothetical protein